jgi:hypothetical protein
MPAVRPYIKSRGMKMKANIRYPIISLENQEIEISPQEAEKLQEMGSSEKAIWAYMKLTMIDLPTWKEPVGPNDMKSAFSVGIGEIQILEAEQCA